MAPKEQDPGYPVAQPRAIREWSFLSAGEKNPNAHFALGHFVSIPSLSLKSGMHNCDICNANNEQLVIFLIKSL